MLGSVRVQCSGATKSLGVLAAYYVDIKKCHRGDHLGGIGKLANSSAS
ncbi:MAG: hypothetical protein ACR2OA_01695 [Rubripirellula sp.]